MKNLKFLRPVRYGTGNKQKILNNHLNRHVRTAGRQQGSTLVRIQAGHVSRESKKKEKTFFNKRLYLDFQKDFNALGEALLFFREKIQFFFSTDKKQVTKR